MARLDVGGVMLGRLFSPRSVVVVGATERAGSYGAQTLLNLRRAAYAGAVTGVHPSRSTVFGYPCVPTLASVEEPPDAVVLAVPADAVVSYVREAALLGAGGCIVYAAGRIPPSALAEAASGMPVIGPNGNGFVSVVDRVPLWGDAVSLPAAAGPIAVISQSGNVGVLALAHRGGLGLHSVTSLGNAVVVDAAATLEWAASAGARSVALYLEGDGDGARLATALARCADADVRVTALEAGRSSAGRAAAGAHTASLAGDHRVFAALIEEAGGVTARDPHHLFETARALAVGRRKPGSVAILTASGGDAAIAADLASDLQVPLAPLSPSTRARLAAALPDGLPVTNPLDHTNAVWADTATIGELTAALAADPEVDHVVYIQDEPPGLPASDAAEWRATRDGAAGALLVASTPGQEPADAISSLPALFTALTALRRPAPSPARLREIASTAGSFPPSVWLAEHEAKDLLGTAGVPCPDRRVHPLPCDVAAVVASAGSLGYPVALKVSRAGLLHKSDAGLLALSLSGPVAVEAALARFQGEAGTLLVERMVPAGPEAFVAATTDGVVPALVVGVGGVWAEVISDVAVIPLPAGASRVFEALRGLRGARMLGDLSVLAGFAASLGELLLAERLSLIEVNPVIGGVAVDALARR